MQGKFLYGELVLLLLLLLPKRLISILLCHATHKASNSLDNLWFGFKLFRIYETDRSMFYRLLFKTTSLLIIIKYYRLSHDVVT